MVCLSIFDDFSDMFWLLWLASNYCKCIYQSSHQTLCLDGLGEFLVQKNLNGLGVYTRQIEEELQKMKSQSFGVCKADKPRYQLLGDVRPVGKIQRLQQIAVSLLFCLGQYSLADDFVEIFALVVMKKTAIVEESEAHKLTRALK